MTHTHTHGCHTHTHMKITNTHTHIFDAHTHTWMLRVPFTLDYSSVYVCERERERERFVGCVCEREREREMGDRGSQIKPIKLSNESYLTCMSHVSSNESRLIYQMSHTSYYVLYA